MLGQDSQEDVSATRLFKLFSLAIAVLAVSRVITFAQYVWSSKYWSKQVFTAALRSEFAMENLKTDATIGVMLAVGSALLLPIEISFITCLLGVALCNSFRRRPHEPAVGLAWSFYFGYLKKVLPKFSGNVNRSRYKDCTLPKLLILVPADCKIHTSLEDADDRITFQENLEPHQENVAGIQERRYIHSSYRIEGKGCQDEPLYVAMEYATPLNTLREMCASSKASFTESDRDRQALLFYKTIKDIIDTCSVHDNPVIKDNVEFVFLPRNTNIVDKILEVAGIVSSK